MDEFEEPALAARRSVTPPVDGNTPTHRRFAIARVVSRVYRAANGAMRADMVAHLVRPLGLLGLVAVASGAFARLMRRDGIVPDTLAAEDMVRYSSEQIRELTLFVHEVNPDALQPLVEQLAQSTVGVAALSTAALVLLLRSSRRAPTALGKSASAAASTGDSLLCAPAASLTSDAAQMTPGPSKSQELPLR